MDGLKRPRDEDDGCPASGDGKEDEKMTDGNGEVLVTMMDIFTQQKELEEEAMRKETEEGGDETRCTADSVCFLMF